MQEGEPSGSPSRVPWRNLFRSILNGAGFTSVLALFFIPMALIWGICSRLIYEAWSFGWNLLGF